MRVGVVISSILFSAGACFSQDIPMLVAEKCSGCHQTPRPGSMPRYIWPKINAKMVDFMQAASLPINGTEMEAINSYYEANSPENLALIPDVFGETGLNFRKMSVGQTSFAERPQITSVKIYDVDGDGSENDALVTDNNLGAVTWLKNREGKWSESTIAKIPSPVNTTPFDFEGDGDLDFAVSAMGYMHPNDELIGELHLLINDGDGKFDQRVLVNEVPRITDCAPGDFDGDGDMDFVVAMFGWRETGRVCLLRQEANGEFVQESIYEINGCMRVLPNDADGDGDLDFVALVTQQHETIAQFVNDGTGAFETKVIARAAHPAFGSSSIFLHDLDEDGDEDILYTNGDMMDEHPEPKPYHGVRWLENDGKGVYELHHLASMPGCYDAKPADMDGDGDLDLVISALYFQWDQHDFPSLAWLENLGGFRDFTPRRIAFAPTNLANIAVGDIDQNGKPDILAGGMHVPGPLERKGRITVWLQE